MECEIFSRVLKSAQDKLQSLSTVHRCRTQTSWSGAHKTQSFSVVQIEECEPNVAVDVQHPTGWRSYCDQEIRSGSVQGLVATPWTSAIFLQVSPPFQTANTFICPHSVFIWKCKKKKKRKNFWETHLDSLFVGFWKTSAPCFSTLPNVWAQCARQRFHLKSKCGAPMLYHTLLNSIVTSPFLDMFLALQIQLFGDMHHTGFTPDMQSRLRGSGKSRLKFCEDLGHKEIYLAVDKSEFSWTKCDCWQGMCFC